MRKWLYLSFVLSVAIPLWAQSEQGVTSEATQPTNEDQMAVPPPVSGATYPTEVGGEMRTNYVIGGLVFSPSYVNNIFPGTGSQPLSGMTYSVSSVIGLDQTTPRQHRQFHYSPGFTMYQPASFLDGIDQDVTAQYEVRLTPHTALSAENSFRKSTTPFINNVVSGSLPSMGAGIIAPFAENKSNTSGMRFSLQLAPNTMIGASGSTIMFRYPNNSRTSGLYNSDQRGGSVFYNHRFSVSRYAGMNYQYSWVHAYPGKQQSEANIASVIQTHAVYAFYTIFPARDLSISVSGGIQHYQIAETSLAEVNSWVPMVMASMGWQASRTSFSASFSRQASGGGGLLGAYIATRTSASFRRQMSSSWTAGAEAAYSINQSISSQQFMTTQPGNSISGSVSVTRSLSRSLSMDFSYDHLHQSYRDISAIASNPDSDRLSISLKWQFMRPLGR